ncbi:Cloroperoxidase [Mycena kentingensis (nom. inval.)]|nr:Cloroperoxidase [Mycena kentingensis (nom. inval.)]
MARTLCWSLFLLLPLRAFASPTTEVQDGTTGTLIVVPPQATDTGVKHIPDAAHPFIAPGLSDQRGPCPAMNTLANHGYIPRNGIATFEQIMLAMMEAFNIESNFGSIMLANNMLTRANVFTNQISIGGVSDLIPPMPHNVDGPEVGGISKHGRFEGDASMTRADALLGDNVHFQDILYDMDLLSLGKFGANGPEGDNTVWNLDALIAMKKQNIQMDQAANRGFEFPARRVNAAFTQAAFIVNVFANGTTKEASLSTIGSFFRNQTFPENWFRAAAPVTGAASAATVNLIMAGVGIVPGRNNANGVYVPDPLPPAPWNASFACTVYYDQASNEPATFVNVTGLFKQNVDTLTNIQFAAVAGTCNEKKLPFGPVGV